MNNTLFYSLQFDNNFSDRYFVSCQLRWQLSFSYNRYKTSIRHAVYFYLFPCFFLNEAPDKSNHSGLDITIIKRRFINKRVERNRKPWWLLFCNTEKIERERERNSDNSCIIKANGKLNVLYTCICTLH